MAFLGIQQDRSHPAADGAQAQQANSDPCSHSLRSVMKRLWTTLCIDRFCSVGQIAGLLLHRAKNVQKAIGS